MGMKGLKKILSLVMGLLLALSVGKVAKAAPSVPDSTAVTIHKIVGTETFTLRTHDGHELAVQEIAALGTKAVENNKGVEFTAWQVPAGTLVSTFEGMTDAEVTASELTGDPVSITAGDAKDFLTGTYYVRETKRPATLIASYGVPFIMELPVLNVVGDGYLRELHLYPKNMIEPDIPTIDKDVKTKGNDTATFDIGEKFTYLIYPTVPKGIQDYTLFKVFDKLPTTIDYIGNVVVTYNGTILTLATDYTVAADTSKTDGHELTVNFTAAGLDKLGAATGTVKELEIKFDAKINATAVMNEKIYNNATLTYNNGYIADTAVDVPDGNQPEVHTGGHQFIKVDNVTKTYLEVLKDATFVVKKGEGETASYMKVTNGNITWVAKADATILKVDKDNGTFEVKGLAYGTYTLVEVDVPTDYIRMADQSFNVGETTYGSTTSIEDNTKVINVKRPHIPDTGGIGTIIFFAGGLLIMGAAILALKKRRNA
jgi:fimbrial isopeptide formation D2 family protein/LPXTG-motif cell wall-anchored protein